MSVSLDRDDWEFAERKPGQSVYVFLGPRPSFCCFHKDMEQLRAAELAGFKYSGRTDMDREAPGTACSLHAGECGGLLQPQATDVCRCEEMPPWPLPSEASCIKCDCSLQLSGGGFSAESTFTIVACHSSHFPSWSCSVCVYFVCHSSVIAAWIVGKAAL